MKSLWLLALTLGAVLALPGLVRACTATSSTETMGAPVDLCTVAAFTPDVHFLSLPGYLRLHYFKDHGTWITREDAVTMADAQQQICLVNIPPEHIPEEMMPPDYPADYYLPPAFVVPINIVAR